MFFLKHQQAAAPASHQLQQSEGKTLTIEAKPVLRNKIAEITRFVPTSLLVRRGGANESTAITSSISSNNSVDRSVDHHYNHYSQPYDYMSQQQQSYAHMNPLMVSNSNARKSDIQQQPQARQQPSNTKLASTDSAYESFMKEIGKLL